LDGMNDSLSGCVLESIASSVVTLCFLPLLMIEKSLTVWIKFLTIKTIASKLNSESLQSAGNQYKVKIQVITTKTSNIFEMDFQKCYKIVKIVN
jgi:hypothetical protein